MSIVVHLSDYLPHQTGSAVCTHCRHEWQAVAPEGVYRNLECPACATFHGVMIGGCEPEEGGEVFTCNCGADVFIVQPGWIMCCNCGQRHLPEAYA